MILKQDREARHLYGYLGFYISCNWLFYEEIHKKNSIPSLNEVELLHFLFVCLDVLDSKRD
jgi:hypothetical protein